MEESDRRERVERARERLASAFTGAGWTVVETPGDPEAPDLLLRRGERLLVIEVRAAALVEPRSALRALLADALLQARGKARGRGAQALAVLAVDELPDDVVAELDGYARKFADGCGWGVLDERGRLELDAPDLADVVLPHAEPVPHERAARAHAAQDPFTDVGQWLIKVILSAGVPERWLGAPRGRLRGVADLAALGGVSVASASRCLAALEAAGYLAETGEVVRLARIEALFEAWRAAARRPVEEHYLRFLVPPPDPRERLQKLLAGRARRQADLASLAGLMAPAEPGAAGRELAGPRGSRACLALFSACAALDAGRFRGGPAYLYAEELSPELLEALELRPAEHRADAEVIARRPPFPESVFRACVDVHGTPVSDLVQCWLDVSFHPTRGAEQASDIERLLQIAELGR